MNIHTSGLEGTHFQPKQNLSIHASENLRTEPVCPKTFLTLKVALVCYYTRNKIDDSVCKAEERREIAVR